MSRTYYVAFSLTDHYLILPHRKENGLTPTIEEYNYDYYATGKVVRPPIMEKYEDEVAKVYQVRRNANQLILVEILTTTQHSALSPRSHSENDEAALSSLRDGARSLLQDA